MEVQVGARIGLTDHRSSRLSLKTAARQRSSTTCELEDANTVIEVGRHVRGRRGFGQSLQTAAHAADGVERRVLLLENSGGSCSAHRLGKRRLGPTADRAGLFDIELAGHWPERLRPSLCSQALPNSTVNLNGPLMGGFSPALNDSFTIFRLGRCQRFVPDLRLLRRTARPGSDVGRHLQSHQCATRGD